MRLRLASRSPRRAALLEAAGIAFVPGPWPSGEERLPADRAPAEAVAAVAAAKAREALAAAPDDVVLAADTLVFLDGQPLGKPRDGAEAEAFLRALSGRRHDVVTAVAVAWSRGGRPVVRTACATTRVTFRPLRADGIAAHVASGEPLDKAGAYALQGGARAFVAHIDGDEDTVIGLPIGLVRRLLAEVPGDPAPPGED